MDENIIIRATDLVKIYGKEGTEVKALDGVSLDVPKGQFLAVTGESGGGKSTLLHMLGGVDSLTSGTIFVDGENITDEKDAALSIYRRRKVGFVFQFYNLIPVLNVEENITLPFALDGKKIPKDRLDELLEILGISERRFHFPHQLSGGQQQRVAIARALIGNPSIVLADEPTGNLDSKNTGEIVSLLRDTVKKYNQTLVMITHDLSIAARADRIIRMRDGKIVSDEPTLAAESNLADDAGTDSASDFAQ